MKTLQAFGMLCFGLILAAQAVAQQTLSLSPVPEERVFSAPEITPAPQAIPNDPFADSESFHSDSFGGDYGGEAIADDFVGEIVQGPIYVDQAPIPIFTRVKYVDHREKHPHAVTKIVAVNNPVLRQRRVCKDCEPECVYIEICVPPCGREDVVCRRGGDRVRYDYGKYKVDIRIRRGYIVVDYQR